MTRCNAQKNGAIHFLGDAGPASCLQGINNAKTGMADQNEELVVSEGEVRRVLQRLRLMRPHVYEQQGGRRAVVVTPGMASQQNVTVGSSLLGKTALSYGEMQQLVGVDALGKVTAPTKAVSLSRDVYQSLEAARATAEGKRQHEKVRTRIIVGSTVTVSLGLAIWSVRGGALVTSMLSSLPLWRGFDPLPILAGGGPKEKLEAIRKTEEEERRENAKLADILDDDLSDDNG